MPFKVDENLHTDVAELLRQRGHDAMTVYDQGLRGHPARDIAAVCAAEGRAILTADLDFADIRAFPPQNYAGIIVLRLSDQSRPAVLRVIHRLLPLFGVEPLVGCLWIVDDDRIRIRQGVNP